MGCHDIVAALSGQSYFWHYGITYLCDSIPVEESAAGEGESARGSLWYRSIDLAEGNVFPGGISCYFLVVMFFIRIDPGKNFPGSRAGRTYKKSRLSNLLFNSDDVTVKPFRPDRT